MADQMTGLSGQCFCSVCVCVCIWFEGMGVLGSRTLRGAGWETASATQVAETCMFAADPYTLTEHFLNLSCVFLRPK